MNKTVSVVIGLPESIKTCVRASVGDLRAICKASDEGIGAGVDIARANMARLDELIAATPVLAAALERASVPATADEISRMFQLLVASRPEVWERAARVESTRRIAELWTATMLDDITSLRPSSGAIEAAGRTLRLTRGRSDYQDRHLPSSPEIADEIQNAERDIAAAKDYLKSLPARRARLSMAIEDAERFLARRAEKAGQRLAAESGV